MDTKSGSGGKKRRRGRKENVKCCQDGGALGDIGKGRLGQEGDKSDRRRGSG